MGTRRVYLQDLAIVTMDQRLGSPPNSPETDETAADESLALETKRKGVEAALQRPQVSWFDYSKSAHWSGLLVQIAWNR